MVLLHDTKLKNQYTGKLDVKWIRLYHVTKVNHEQDMYRIAELDGLELGSMIGTDRLKPYYMWAQRYSRVAETESVNRNDDASEAVQEAPAGLKTLPFMVLIDHTTESLDKENVILDLST